jgi:hypothetical protein
MGWRHGANGETLDEVVVGDQCRRFSDSDNKRRHSPPAGITDDGQNMVR